MSRGEKFYEVAEEDIADSGRLHIILSTAIITRASVIEYGDAWGVIRTMQFEGNQNIYVGEM